MPHDDNSILELNGPDVQRYTAEGNITISGDNSIVTKDGCHSSLICSDKSFFYSLYRYLNMLNIQKVSSA